jgi:hypothetical protein
VHPTGGSLRVFSQFARLGVGSRKLALPRPAHQRVTRALEQQSLIISAHIIVLLPDLGIALRREDRLNEGSVSNVVEKSPVIRT